MTSQRHSCITNSIPEGTILPMHTCHPVMTPESRAIMAPGTAFQMVMGSMYQKICRGVFVSPTEWYVDGVTRPVVVSLNNVDLDLRSYPGSHVTQTKTPAVWATMGVMRITEIKAFETMVRKIDTRILHEIQHRIPVVNLENTSALPDPALQFTDDVCTVPRCKYECRTCLRGFTSSKGYERHKCGAADELAFTCGVCDKVYKSQAWLAHHVSTIHNNRTTTKIAQLQVPPDFQLQHQAHLESQRPIPPSPFRFEESISMVQHGHVPQFQEIDRTSRPQAQTALPLQNIDLPAHFHVVENFSIDERAPFVAESHATVVPHQQRQAAIYDDLFDDESSHHVMTPPEGLTTLEVLDIAHGWDAGQEFIMTYKERGGPHPSESYESHGMLHRWDFSLASPGPLVFYAVEGTRHRYCEEPLECSEENVILSLVPIAPTAAFDRKRRDLNKSQKRSRPLSV